MKTIKKHECIAIKETDPDVFSAKYIQALDGIGNAEVIKQFSDGYFIAIITWHSVEEQAETVKDEFHLEGLRYVCGQCPHLEQDYDGRKKRFPCKYSEFSSVDIRQECCELFYKQLKQGLIEPM